MDRHKRPCSPPYRSAFTLIILPAVLVFSCVSSPALKMNKAPVLEEFVPQWENLAYGEGSLPSLAITAGKISDPPLEFWALRADLGDPRLSIVVGPPSIGGKPGSVPSTKVSSFVRDYDCIAGINANPFEPSTAVEGEDRSVVGLAVSAGTLIAAPHERYDALVFYRDPGGNLYAAIVGQTGAFKDVEHAVGGFYRILENGEVTAGDGPRHPRSAAGLSAAGTILYLLVIDGRRPGSGGATEAETGRLLRRLGALEGLCFDGGGSSALAVRAFPETPAGPEHPGGEGSPPVSLRLLNKPVHRFIPGIERAVAVCLGIGFH